MGKFLVALKKLEHWFETQKRVLPWRNDPSFYRVWISEIMLQQTQVITVVPYFQKFITAFPSVEKLAGAAVDQVMLHWAGLGYYSRARNLHLGAQAIVAQGRFPQTREEWLEVPGVGPYTAGAILSIAGNAPEAILDGNIERVLSRVRVVSRAKGDVDFKARLWIISKIFVEAAYRHQISPSVLNQSLMELGATVCTPRHPLCDQCPLSGICRAYQQGVQLDYPPKRKRKAFVTVQETLHCWMNDKGRVLLRQREKGEWRAGLWDFLDASPDGLKIPAVSLGQVKTRHVVTHHKIERLTKIWRVSKQLPKRAPQQWRWISPEEPEVAVGSALRRALAKVVEVSLISDS